MADSHGGGHGGGGATAIGAGVIVIGVIVALAMLFERGPFNPAYRAIEAQRYVPVQRTPVYTRHCCANNRDNVPLGFYVIKR